jgi:spermidine synthase
MYAYLNFAFFMVLLRHAKVDSYNRFLFFFPTSSRGKKNNSGLGVGISAASMIQHGCEVDIVEIDPEVYRMAREHFFLPEPARALIQDGRKYINEAESGLYDYVFHDVFTGGSVPPGLFSVAALEQIKRIMKPGGVLALVCDFLFFISLGIVALFCLFKGS